jgi:hypothetical protein
MSSTNIEYQAPDPSSLVQSETLKLQGAAESVESFKVINRGDFGHDRIGLIESKFGVQPVKFIRDHLNPIMKTMNDTIKQSKKLDVDTLVPNNHECSLLVNNFFKIIPFDIRFLESINMTRSASSVVNVIWTTPTTDTAVLKTSGRSLVYGLLYDKLSARGAGSEAFKRYISDQFVNDLNPNPAFLMNYQNMFPDNYVSGDLNFFGFREFETKWNCLTFYDSSVYHVLSFIDKKILKEIKDASTDSSVVKVLDTAIENNAQKTDKNTKKNPKRNVRNEAPLKTVGIFYEDAFKDNNFKEAAKRMGFDDPAKQLKAADLPSFLLKLKNVGSGSLGVFVSQLNGVVAQAYRENEHLYDCQITKPIDLSILPGMIVDSTYPEFPEFNKPRFRGYVTAVSHTIDFNAATMKSNFSLTRTASDDSAMVKK